MEPGSRFEASWAANTAQTAQENAFNWAVVETLHTVNRGHLPALDISPSMSFVQSLTRLATARLRPELCDLGCLLDQHIDFAEIADWGPRASNPSLIMGAIDLLSGHLRVFSSRSDLFCSEHVRASCAVPTIFPAVEAEGTAYWDDIFSDSPPVAEKIKDQFVGRDDREGSGSPVGSHHGQHPGAAVGEAKQAVKGDNAIAHRRIALSHDRSPRRRVGLVLQFHQARKAERISISTANPSIC